jgi:hypothetical protein
VGNREFLAQQHQAYGIGIAVTASAAGRIVWGVGIINVASVLKTYQVFYHVFWCLLVCFVYSLCTSVKNVVPN